MKTVRVKSSHPDHEQGFFVINEEDFDPKKHELWEEDQAAKPAAGAARHARPAAKGDTHGSKETDEG